MPRHLWRALSTVGCLLALLVASPAWASRTAWPKEWTSPQRSAELLSTVSIGEDGIRQYVYDEDSRFLEYDTSGNQIAKYSYGADRLISLVRADEGTRFYHLDGLGSVTALTDPSGTVTSRLHLDAWGVFRNPDEMSGPGASKNRFAFTGYVFDRETELYFAKARFYDPTVGRFISQDSFLGEIDAPPSLHRYFYAAANPLRYVDPTGHAFTEAEKREIGRQFVQRTAPLQRDKRADHEKGWGTNFGETFFAEFTGRLFSPGFKTYEGLKNMSKLGDGSPRLFIEGQLETVASAAVPLVVREVASAVPLLNRSVSELAGAGLAKLRGAFGRGGGAALEPMAGSLPPVAPVPGQLRLFPDVDPLPSLKPLGNVGGGSQGAEAASGQLELNFVDPPSTGQSRVFYGTPKGDMIVGSSDLPLNAQGGRVVMPEGHVLSPLDPSLSAPPIIRRGPFTTAQREALLRGSPGDTRLAPHHRGQLPVEHGGVIDELPGPGNPGGNVHTGQPRHRNPSIFNRLQGGGSLRSAETRAAWTEKGGRLVEVSPGVWIDPAGK